MPRHPYHHARKHLSLHVPVLAPIIERVGPCTLQPNPDSFSVLARSIISQQISTKAAFSISGRLIKIVRPAAPGFEKPSAFGGTRRRRNASLRNLYE